LSGFPLSSCEQVHQTYLAQHFTSFDAWRLDQAPALMPGSPHFHLMTGLLAQQERGLAVVYQAVQQQASLLAYNDIYRLLALAAAIFSPGFLLLKRPRTAGPAAH
jgi:hypothetical protein